VLLVQPQPTTRPAVEACGTDRRPMSVVHCPTLDDARHYLATHRVDLAVVESQQPDGDGFALIDEIRRATRTTATVVLAESADFADAQRALRCGADDLILKQTDGRELAQRLAEALDKRTRAKAAEQRIDRLHRLCKKLNAARVEVSKQVDILCNDLVTAYQELACQMQNVVQSTEYGGLIENELDLEKLLRVTLEHLMAKLGPANAAIFLPATMDEYSLGGYVNYDCTGDSASLVLEQLGDGLAPQVAAGQEMVVYPGRPEIERALGEDASLLQDAGLVAAPCMNGDECLAVLMLFRDTDQPFTDEHLDRVSSLAPMLGDALQRIIRVHHRSIFQEEAGESPDDFFGDELPF
jgi:DNA-binding response OmpR family regulator